MSTLQQTQHASAEVHGAKLADVVVAELDVVHSVHS